MGPLGWAGFVILVGLALWIGKMSLNANLQHACDARQWTGFEVCTRSAPAERVGPAGAEWDRLRRRVATNPGDSQAMAAMARYAGLPQEAIGMEGAVLLDLLARAVPRSAEVLQQQSIQALSRMEWGQAVPRLIRLSVQHRDLEASRALARLAVLSSQDKALLAVMREAVRNEPQWGEGLVAAMRAEKLPFLPALVVFNDMVVSDAIKTSTGLSIVRGLKLEGHWLDAHALWLQLWKRPLELVHNGDFERDFVPNTFDWDFATGQAPSAGAYIDRIGAKDRGEVLRIRFTGKALGSPVLKHDLFLPSGSYRFDSDVRTLDIRGAGGFMWTVSCANGGKLLASSKPLVSSDRQWMPLTFFLDVPEACQASTLALVPGNSVEARAGAQGELMLDGVRMTRTETGDQRAVR
jgi:hypothetical protein